MRMNMWVGWVCLGIKIEWQDQGDRRQLLIEQNKQSVLKKIWRDALSSSTKQLLPTYHTLVSYYFHFDSSLQTLLQLMTRHPSVVCCNVVIVRQELRVHHRSTSYYVNIIPDMKNTAYHVKHQDDLILLLVRSSDPRLQSKTEGWTNSNCMNFRHISPRPEIMSPLQLYTPTSTGTILPSLLYSINHIIPKPDNMPHLGNSPCIPSTIEILSNMNHLVQ